MKVFIAFLVGSFLLAAVGAPGKRDRFIVVLAGCVVTAAALYSHRFA
jgi:hypothetical protein